MHIGKEEIKLTIFANDMILYIKDTKKKPSQKKTLRSLEHSQQSSRIDNQYTKISSFSKYQQRTG
jgi:hypothetical protein